MFNAVNVERKQTGPKVSSISVFMLPKKMASLFWMRYRMSKWYCFTNNYRKRISLQFGQKRIRFWHQNIIDDLGNPENPKTAVGF